MLYIYILDFGKSTKIALIELKDANAILKKESSKADFLDRLVYKGKFFTPKDGKKYYDVVKNIFRFSNNVVYSEVV